MEQKSAIVMQEWPQESREAAELVIDAHGEPHELTDSQLTWYDTGGWKRIIASRVFHEHAFPAPHIDCVESVLDYHVPPEKATELAVFDGSVIIDRTAGEISARCHDEQANFLALNLAHDIVTGSRTPREARAYYAEEFLNARRKGPTPYMERLRFTPHEDTKDPDERVLSDAQLEEAVSEGKQKG